MPEVTLTANQPLALGARPRAGAPTLSHLHVPGSVLRGALAEAWIIEHGEPSRAPDLRPAFIALFERGVRFGPLFAPGSTVVPLSVLRCKYLPTSACTGVWCDEAYNEVPAACPECAGPLVYGRGDVEFVSGSAGPPTTRTTRVALTADGTAKENHLYTREAIAPYGADGAPRRFSGRIIGGGDWLLGERRLFVGGRRSVAGVADYLAEPDTPGAPDAEGDRLIIRLMSPAVLVDHAGRPSSEPDTNLLSELLDAQVNIGRTWIRRTRVGGWHAVADLPKPDDHAVTAGSTYELLLDNQPNPAAVQRLLDRGIGLRRAEGLGWIEAARWHPPEPPAAPAGAKPDAVAQGMSEMITNLPGDQSRWLLGELRRNLTHLAAGGARNTELLRRPRMEVLTGRQRRYLTLLLMEQTPSRIAAVADALEARIRGVKT